MRPGSRPVLVQTLEQFREAVDRSLIGTHYALPHGEHGFGGTLVSQVGQVSQDGGNGSKLTIRSIFLKNYVIINNKNRESEVECTSINLKMLEKSVLSPSAANTVW